ncbi:ESPR-type extended signal peptide-containing protein [Caballeronia sp. dw_19]|uniref:ESPR-type extended signal peptide-containing protein n=1 Tax=Caballeronia sp. dw_19 TaxID=2719791 RepID=UPI001BD5FCDD|nr:ESPR-type extended signal peptide-containing protein [Caballeronia sp. dw_19]
MNKSFKSVLNRSTGTYVAASENVKSSGKSAKNKLAMKVASASLALGASIAMLSSGSAVADDSVPASGYQVDLPDAADGSNGNLDAVVSLQADDSDSLTTGSTGNAKVLGSTMLGSQLFGATPTGSSVLYDDSTYNRITFQGTAGTKLTNVAAGTLSATSTDAVNGAQLFHITDGTSVINSAYVQVGGANNGTDNAVLSGSGVAIGASARADTDTVAVGGNAVASSNGMYGSMAIGTSANGGAGGTAIGYHTLSTGISSVALGKGATAGGGIQQLWAPGPRQADTTRWRSGRLRSPQGIIP